MEEQGPHFHSASGEKKERKLYLDLREMIACMKGTSILGSMAVMNPGLSQSDFSSLHVLCLIEMENLSEIQIRSRIKALHSNLIWHQDTNRPLITISLSLDINQLKGTASMVILMVAQFSEHQYESDNLKRTSAMVPHSFIHVLSFSFLHSDCISL